mmetsp:Transcript_36558/g.85462  ORF Transcript_36558/g.85462 Transcript_36558/m.85462 type:complete len:586 (-) Transcript_36558:150-1907(-)
MIRNQLQIILLVSSIVGAKCGAYISGERLQNPDNSITIGRGYSRSTGAIMGSCLNANIEKDNVPMDYDFQSIEVPYTMEDASTVLSKHFMNALGYNWVKKNIESKMVEVEAQKKVVPAKLMTYFQHVVTSMRAERYFSGIDEIETDLTDETAALLQKSEYTTFFQICGPMYIRSFRRAAEVTTVFTYETITEDPGDYGSLLINDITGVYSDSPDDTFYLSDGSQAKKTLTASMRAWGLVLGDEEAPMLKIRNMRSFNDVMDYAFRSMRTSNVGIPVGIEVVPWVSNPKFRWAAKLTTDFEGTICSPPGSSNCASVQFSKHILAHNMMTNAEYIARLEKIVNDKILQYYMMEQCSNIAWSFPPEEEKSLLVNHHSLIDGNIEEYDPNMRYTDPGQEELKMWEISSSDYKQISVHKFRNLLSAERLRLVREEVINYFMKYVDPCYTALTHNIGQYKSGMFMTKSYDEIAECSDHVCGMPSAVWDGAKCVRKETTMPIFYDENGLNKDSAYGNEMNVCDPESNASICVKQDIDVIAKTYCMPMISGVKPLMTSGDSSQADEQPVITIRNPNDTPTDERIKRIKKRGSN